MGFHVLPRSCDAKSVEPVIGKQVRLTRTTDRGLNHLVEQQMITTITEQLDEYHVKLILPDGTRIAGWHLADMEDV